MNRKDNSRQGTWLLRKFLLYNIAPYGATRHGNQDGHKGPLNRKQPSSLRDER